MAMLLYQFVCTNNLTVTKNIGLTFLFPVLKQKGGYEESDTDSPSAHPG